MKKLLEDYGFRYVGVCHCIGPKTYKYKKDSYSVYWSALQKKFKLKNFGKSITPTLNESNFKNIWEAEIEKLPA